MPRFKEFFLMGLTAAAIVLLAAQYLKASPPMHTAAAADASAPFSDGPQTNAAGGYHLARVRLLSEFQGFKTVTDYTTEDPAVITYIDETLRNCNIATEAAPVTNGVSEFLIELTGETGSYSSKLFYDNLPDRAYIVQNGDAWEAPIEFAVYTDNLLENARTLAPVDDEAAAALFQQYGWTLGYQISASDLEINQFKTLSDFDPNAYYFAYNNELSKDIGLDMSRHAGGSLDVSIYHLRESLPTAFYPLQSCRGILLKSGGKIVGAYISAGRHNAFAACSLKGNGFEAVTGQTADEWLLTRFRASKEEKQLAKLTPEQVIKAYFDALNRKDEATAARCVSKSMLLGSLTVNMADEALFNEHVYLPLVGGDSPFENLRSAKLLHAERWDSSNEALRSLSLRYAEQRGLPAENILVLVVTADLQYHEADAGNNGEQIWECYMVHESPQTGWKILEFGH